MKNRIIILVRKSARNVRTYIVVLMLSTLFFIPFLYWDHVFLFLYALFFISGSTRVVRVILRGSIEKEYSSFSSHCLYYGIFFSCVGTHFTAFHLYGFPTTNPMTVFVGFSSLFIIWLILWIPTKVKEYREHKLSAC